METAIVSSVSDQRRADTILAAAGRLFLGPGRVNMDDLARELGMSKKTIYRHFPDKHGLMIAVLDRQFAAIEGAVVQAAEDTADQPFAMQIQRFLLAVGSEFRRIGAAQLAVGRGDAVLRKHVEERIDAVVYRPLGELYRHGHRLGLLSAPPELLTEITRGAVERLLNGQLSRELDCTAADLLRATVDTVLHGAIRPATE